MHFEAILIKIKEAIAVKNSKKMMESLEKFCTDFDNPHFFSKDEHATLVQVKPVLRDVLAMALNFFMSRKQHIENCQNDSQLQLAQAIYDNLNPYKRLINLSFLRPDRVMQPIYGKPPKEETFLFPEKYLWQMDPDYWREDDMALYLTQKEKKPFKVKVRSDSDTNLLYRPFEKGGVLPNGNYLYIVSPKGGLYIAQAYNVRGHLTDPNGDVLNHSSFRAGQPVLCAGHCKIENGEIKKIDVHTGHYKITTEGLIMACFHLYHENLINQECVLECYDGKRMTMKEVLANPAYNFLCQEYFAIKQTLPHDAGMETDQSLKKFSF